MNHDYCMPGPEVVHQAGRHPVHPSSLLANLQVAAPWTGTDAVAVLCNTVTYMNEVCSTLHTSLQW